MTKIVVGVFEDMTNANQAVSELQSNGFDRSDIDVRSGEDIKSRWGAERSENENDGFWESIKHFFTGGSDGAEEHRMSRVTERDVLVTVHVTDAMAEEAADILDRYGAVNLEERAAGTAGTGDAATAAGARAGAEQKIPVVEEELKVGKRQVSGGGVRLRSRVVERPVEAELNLREEEVHVEREAVDRPLGAADEAAFEEKTFEVRETSEEPVVQKRARVKEEVSVTKESRQRKEKVRDKVRSTNVEVTQLNPEEQKEFATYESDFQNEWQTKYARTSGMQYQDVAPGYQYGYRLGRNPQYKQAKWEAIEPEVKRDWDQRGFGPWEQYRDAVRSGWERTHH